MPAAKVRKQPNSRASPRTRASAQHLDELLDEALVETFPASDPVSTLADGPKTGGRDELRPAPADRKS